VIITHSGMSIRFHENDLRDQGRATRGVRGIKLRAGDFVETFEIVDPDATLLIAGENGLAKRTPFDEYRLQSRGGSGIIAIRSANVAGALAIREDEEIVCLTSAGQTIRCPVKDIRVIGRTTRGVKLVNLAENERLIGIARIVEVAEEEA
jgi:DNA gyrase subunit A